MISVEAFRNPTMLNSSFYVNDPGAPDLIRDSEDLRKPGFLLSQE
jgi:hypothetical protein